MRFSDAQSNGMVRVTDHAPAVAPSVLYTLTELLIVVFIILLVLGLALPRLVRMPAGPVIEKTLADLERPFKEAGLRARATGRPVALTLDLERSCFVIGNPSETAHAPRRSRQPSRTSNFTEKTGNAGEPATFKYPVSSEVEWTSTTMQQARKGQVRFLFFPNRETAGPTLSFTCRKRVFQLYLDSLTGDLMITRVRELN